jgi:hypothetical protein
LIADGAGNLYGTTLWSGTFNGYCTSAGASCGTVFELKK